jgi:hypothetical protein
MTSHEANAKIVEIARLMGFEANYRSGLYTLRHNGEYLGQMSAEAWLDHFRHCARKAGRS